MGEQNGQNPMLSAENMVVPQTPIEEKKSRNTLKIAAVTVVVIIFAGGLAYGGWAAYAKYVSNTPEKIIQKTFLTLGDIKSFSFDSATDITVNNTEDKDIFGFASASLPPEILNSDKIKIKTSLSATLDISDTKNIKAKLQLKANVNEKEMIDAQAIFVNDGLYVKADNISVPGYDEFYDLSKIIGQWVKIDLPISVSDFENDNSEKSDAVKKIITEDGYKIFKVKNYAGVEEIDGIKSYHISLEYDQVGITEIFKKIGAVFSEDYDDSYVSEIENSEYWNDANYSLDVWIDKKNYSVQKIYFTSNYTPKDAPDQRNETTIYNFNKQTEFSAPENYKNMKDVMTEVMNVDFSNNMSMSMEDVENRNRDAKRVRDIKQLQMTLEVCFYDMGGYPLTMQADTVCGGKELEYHFIDPWPTIDPKTGEIPYEYRPSTQADGETCVQTPCGYYELIFELEGSLNGLSAGKNVASPNSIKSAIDTDSDGDGITNAEEISIWGTDPDVADSDRRLHGRRGG